MWIGMGDPGSEGVDLFDFDPNHGPVIWRPRLDRTPWPGSPERPPGQVCGVLFGGRDGLSQARGRATVQLDPAPPAGPLDYGGRPALCLPHHAEALTLHVAGRVEEATALLIPILLADEAARAEEWRAERAAVAAREAAERAAAVEAQRAAEERAALRALLVAHNKPTPEEQAASDAHWAVTLAGRKARGGVLRTALVHPDRTISLDEIPWISRIQDIDPVPLSAGLAWQAEVEEGMGMESVPADHPGAVPAAVDWAAIAELASLGVAVLEGRIYVVGGGRAVAERMLR